MAFTGRSEIRPGLIPSPALISALIPGCSRIPGASPAFFLLVSFALQAWARLNLIPGFNLDALEKGMDAAGPWKNLEAPACGNPWISWVFPLVFRVEIWDFPEF